MSEHSDNKKPNRLVNQASLYLRQHAYNPVDWFPWGEEAFQKARGEDKPLFVSIGYSTCHWCHVMERESFEDEGIAQFLNENFVSIKVDREERPDLDEIYMNATQLMTGRGGWPNSVWLTPDGRPWYAGTYFPPKPVSGVPGFGQLLEALRRAWREQRDEVERQAAQMAETIKSISQTGPGGELRREDAFEMALRDLMSYFDPDYGGFDGAPKFPPHSALMLLAYAWEHNATDTQRVMLTGTLNGMARGGVHDQIGGGFHRYSTDARWFLPHFEKMLYDNALLLRAYAEGYRLSGNEMYRSVAERLVEWVTREMKSPEGGFYSALDAESEGEEGKFYVWTKAEIMDVLGPHDGEFFCRVYGIEDGGNFHEEGSGRKNVANIPYLRGPLDKLVELMGANREDALNVIDETRKKLLAAREKRTPPQRDDKILTSWNGLMIGALARAGAIFKSDDLLSMSSRAADFVLANLRREGRLLHSYYDGKAAIKAFLDDYAYLGSALLDLHDATSDTKWLDEAGRIAEQMMELFSDPNAGGFFMTPVDGEPVLARSKPCYDQPLPSGNGVAAQMLVRLWAKTRKDVWFDQAERTLKAFRPTMYSAPHGTHALILAERMLAETAKGKIYPASVSIEPGEISASRGGKAQVTLKVALGEGRHVTDDPDAMKIELAENDAAVIDETTFPTPEKVRFGEEIIQAYRGTMRIQVRLAIRPDAPLGQSRLKVNATVQACTERECLAPVRLDAELTVKVDR